MVLNRVGEETSWGCTFSENDIIATFWALTGILSEENFYKFPQVIFKRVPQKNWKLVPSPKEGQHLASLCVFTYHSSFGDCSRSLPESLHCKQNQPPLSSIFLTWMRFCQLSREGEGQRIKPLTSPSVMHHHGLVLKVHLVMKSCMLSAFI